MTAKEYLEKIRLMDAKVEQLEKEYEDLYKTRDSIPGIDYSKDRVQTSPSGQGFTKTIERLCDMQNEINAQIDEFYNYKHKCIKQIHSIRKLEFIMILFKRYVEYKSFEQISFEMNFSYNYTCKLHGRALNEFEKIIKLDNK